MAKIVISTVGSAELERELGAAPLTIGRDAANDLVLADSAVSRRHARIEPAATGGYRIIDLESGNGVLHQGRRVDSLDLYPGCEVEIGGSVLRFESNVAQPVLVLIAGAPQRSYPLFTEETVLGRAPGNSIAIPHPLVSSRHLKIVRRKEAYAVVDLQSANGTRVNGVRVTSKDLKQGDQIQVGGYTFFFALDGVIPAPDSIDIIQVVQPPSTTLPLSSPVPDLSPRAKPAASASAPRFLLIAWGAGVALLLVVVVAVILLRSPNPSTEPPPQEDSSAGEETTLEASTEAATHEPAAESAARAERERLDRERSTEVASLLERAEALRAEGKLDEARSLLRQALTLDPENAAARKGLSGMEENGASRERQKRIAELTEGGLSRLRAEDFQRADASFSEVLKLDPGNARARELRERTAGLRDAKLKTMYEEGVRLYDAGELAGAMAQFHRILELNPDHAATNRFLPEVLDRVRSEAVDVYKRAYTYEGMGKLRDARDLYRQCVALLPNPREEYHQKAQERIAELDRKLQ